MNSNQLIDAIGAVNDAAVLDAKAFTIGEMLLLRDRNSEK